MAASFRDKALAYCRQELSELNEAEVELFDEICEAAHGYLFDAGVAEPKEPRRLARYNLVAYALVLDAWDRRDITMVGAAIAENPALRQKLNQLKQTEPDHSAVSNLDTATEGSGIA